MHVAAAMQLLRHDNNNPLLAVLDVRFPQRTPSRAVLHAVWSLSYAAAAIPAHKSPGDPDHVCRCG